jgi:hypothetical protein
MDEGQLDLAALAEYVSKFKMAGFVDDGSKPTDRVGRASADWVRVFADAQVCRDQLLQSNQKAGATIVGKFLAARGGRPVDIETQNGPSVATLRSRSGRARQKFYWFELRASGNLSEMAPVSSPSTGIPDFSGPSSLEQATSSSGEPERPAGGPAAQTGGLPFALTHSSAMGETGSLSKPTWL